MPNWVDNEITIKSSQDKIDYIQNKVRTMIQDDEGNDVERHLIAQSLLPMPEEIAMLDGTDTNLRRFKDLDGNVVKVPQMTAMSYYSMNEEELLAEGYTMEKLTDDEIKSLKDKYGASDWYSWNVLNYGTKWGDCDTSCVRVDKTTLIYAFGTAWSPAFPMIEKIARELEVEIEYKYFSIENGDKGNATFNNKGHITLQHWEELDESYYRFDDDVEPVGSTNAQAQKKAQEIFG
jgi:hypothetical protein